MTERPVRRAALEQPALGLPKTVVHEIRARLPDVAAQTVAAIISEVPGYADASDGPLGAVLRQSVQVALAGFLRVASRSAGTDPGTPPQAAIDGAYALGRGEARRGSSTDALLAAYRVGARVSWRELARIAVSSGASADTVAKFAELVFAFIDALSAASVFGHAEERASSNREHQRQRERLTHGLLTGDPTDVVQTAAERVGWRPPDTLTAVLLPGSRGRGLRDLTDPRVLHLLEDLPGVPPGSDVVVLLIPDVHGSGRARLVHALAGRQAVVGPARGWSQVRTSYERALRVHQLGMTLSASAAAPDDALDTEEHLAALILASDPEALADIRREVLAPMAHLRPAAAEKLTETLRAWLLHQGRRDQMAAALFLHPQTVRYRMGQLRELYGEALDDPGTVLAASIALGTWTALRPMSVPAPLPS